LKPQYLPKKKKKKKPDACLAPGDPDAINLGCLGSSDSKVQQSLRTSGLKYRCPPLTASRQCLRRLMLRMNALLVFILFIFVVLGFEFQALLLLDRGLPLELLHQSCFVLDIFRDRVSQTICQELVLYCDTPDLCLQSS
jgi:hypothetical protein